MERFKLGRTLSNMNMFNICKYGDIPDLLAKIRKIKELNFQKGFNLVELMTEILCMQI